MTTVGETLQRLVEAGGALLGRAGQAVPVPFEPVFDEDGTITAIQWHPAVPLCTSRADLEPLGEVALSPRTADTGQLVLIIYHKASRTLLNVLDPVTAQDRWQFESARCIPL